MPISQNVVYLGPVKVDVVPRGQELRTLGPQVVMTRFTDIGIYHPRLIAKILEQEQAMRQVAPTKSHFLGGQKLYHMDEWRYPEMDLLNARVEALFRRHANSAEAHIDHSWINIYRQHDYIAPHCHRRAAISAVYCVEEGETDPDDPFSGSFCFVDPRLESCCQEQKHYMTTPWHIRLRAGSLLMFPAHLIHMVTPYRGTKPRITIAWNVAAQPIPGTPFDGRINDGRTQPA